MCFIEPLFYKVEDGSKTKTRRIKKGKPRYKVGDIVYLKEPYRISNINGGYEFIYQFSKARVKFTGSAKDLEKLLIQQKKSKYGWLNKLFMPESAARVFIEITDVRAERLQDISEEDCIKEGIFYAPVQILSWIEELTPMWSNGFNLYETPQKAYAALIDHINGKGTWSSNPLVYVYGFKKYDRTWEYSQSRG